MAHHNVINKLLSGYSSAGSSSLPEMCCRNMVHVHGSLLSHHGLNDCCY
jgi:hypothetical protein